MPRIDIIEADPDGGFDLDAAPSAPAPAPRKKTAKVEKPPAAKVEKPPPAARPASSSDGATFVSSASFTGTKRGFVFKNGDQGQGYYKDARCTAADATTLPPQPVAPPAEVRLSLLHRRCGAPPELIEVALECGLSSPEEVQVDVTSEHVCVLSSKGWSSSVSVPLKYPVRPAQAQGWLDKGTLTIRLPIAAA